MLKGFKLGDIFKLSGNRVVKDEAKVSAKLPVNKQIARKKSKRIKFVKRTERDWQG